MDEKTLINLITTIDTEIAMYEQLKSYFEDKKATLISNKPLELSEIDVKIIEEAEHIQSVDTKRLGIVKTLNPDIKNMSELINFCKAEKCDEKTTRKLITQKETLANLSKELKLLNDTNIKLIKHGEILSEKRLGIIINAFKPQGNSYSGDGKGTPNSSEKISTIIRDV